MCKRLDLRWGMLDELKGKHGSHPKARLTNGAPGARLSSGFAANSKGSAMTVCSHAVRTVCNEASTRCTHKAGN